VSGLKAGEEKTQPFTNFSYHGEKITICADGGRVIDEANESTTITTTATIRHSAT
jgi:hypothetical protein